MIVEGPDHPRGDDLVFKSFCSRTVAVRPSEISGILHKLLLLHGGPVPSETSLLKTTSLATSIYLQIDYPRLQTAIMQ